MKEKIIELIRMYETIIIHRHINPDLDALASQGGLAELIKTTFPLKKVYVVGAELNELKFLYTMDCIPNSYYYGALVIVCDTDHSLNISDTRYKNAEKVIKIDHHPNDEPFGDLNWIDRKASSTSEMIYELYEYGKEQGFIMTNECAYLLYSGIVGDTGRFQYNNTTEKTFSVVAKLMKFKFSPYELYEQLSEVELRIARFKGYILQDFQITNSGLGFIKIDKQTLKKYKVAMNDVLQIMNTFADVRGVVVWMFLVEELDKINIRLRSDKVQVNQFAKKYQGGGHTFSAGFSVLNWAEADFIIKDLNVHINKHAILQNNLSV